MAAKLDRVKNDAFEALSGGRLDDAARLYDDILKRTPDDAIALHHVGLLHYYRQEHAVAAAYMQKAIAINKNYAEAYCNLGLALAGQKKFDDAILSYRHAIRLRPVNPETYNNMGTVFLGLDKLDEAQAAFRKSIQFKPDYALAYFNLGAALQRQGRHEEAIANFRRAISLAPNIVPLYVGLATSLAASGKQAEAIDVYGEILRLQPQSAEHYNNLGNILLEQKRLDEACDNFLKAIALDPAFALAHYNLGVTLQQQRKVEAAIGAYRQAIVHMPGFAQAYCNLGISLVGQGRLDEGVQAYRKAIEHKPDFPEAFSNLGLPLFRQEKFDEALAAYRQAIALRPDFLDALINLAICLRWVSRQEEAIDFFERAIALDPANPQTWGELISLRRLICDWRHFDADTRRVVELADFVQPFILINTACTPEHQWRNARRWSSNFAVGTPFVHDRVRPLRPIRIGYLSSDFRRHATAYLMSEMFELHDRSRFETFAYSYGSDDGSEERARLMKAFDHFVDIGPASHDAAAQRIYDDQIDILVDLKGHTGQTRTEILVNRPAPIQVNYLGYPGTMGADFMDYIIADAFVAPAEHQPFYTEKIVHVPDCYQPNDSKRVISSRPPSRSEYGLPEQGVVFCCFNGSQKLSPAFFDVWMRLLKATPGSVLWLLKTGALSENNLRREAAARGVAPERLVFAAPLILAEHLARHRLADLFLDTLPCNAHTTASDALWTGLPVLTCAGETFAGRVAGSLVRAAGLPELATSTMEEYEAMARDLALNPQKLAALREKLARNLTTTPLFDTRQRTLDVEDAYQRMFDIWRSGGKPQPFVVEPE